MFQCELESSDECQFMLCHSVYNPPGSFGTKGFPFPVGVGGAPNGGPDDLTPDMASKFLSRSDSQCFVDLSSFKLKITKIIYDYSLDRFFFSQLISRLSTEK